MNIDNAHPYIDAAREDEINRLKQGGILAAISYYHRRMHRRRMWVRILGIQKS